MAFPDRVREPALTDGTARAAFTEAAACVPDEPPPDEACDGTGVIVPGGGARYLPGAYVTTALLRRLGCALPIEIWHIGAGDQPGTEMSRNCSKKTARPELPRVGARLALAHGVLHVRRMPERRRAVSTTSVAVMAAFLVATGCVSAREPSSLVVGDAGNAGDAGDADSAGDANTPDAVGYEVTFKCIPGGVACPPNQECPTVPLGAGGCEDLPGVLGHEPTKVDVGRPLGCQVGLSYGNPYYLNRQVMCDCKTFGSTQPQWLCPI